ncbi:hypothetical protein H0H92_013910 [Tricholoma furcatifolium]|nr:hypothetical protein H0H92_013910 [Tricholoma furcatifolium]
MWGKHWTVCIDALVGFEILRGFPLKERLGTQNRPVDVADWLKHGRKYVDRDLDVEFPKGWWKWWRSLKNEDVSAEDFMDAIVTEEAVIWENLNKAGPTSLILVVLGLAWWGEMIQEFGRTWEGKGSWSQAVREVTEVLQKVGDRKGNDTETTGKKRKESDEEQGEKK